MHEFREGRILVFSFRKTSVAQEEIDVATEEGRSRVYRGLSVEVKTETKDGRVPKGPDEVGLVVEARGEDFKKTIAVIGLSGPRKGQK